MASRYAMGIDFGSASVRTLIVDVEDGREAGVLAVNYSGGEQGVYVSSADAHLARQNPLDYLESMRKSIIGALAKAAEREPRIAGQIIGIGVDTTGSTPIPVAADMTPLAATDKFKDNLNAYAWMWKDHTSMEEAAKISNIARSERPQYLGKCGGTYSSEWFFSKLWHCLNVDPEVFEAAHTWLEFADFIPAVLAGVENPDMAKRCVCAAGHKAMYSDSWGGFPDKEFLAKLDPRLADLRPRLGAAAVPANQSAGALCGKWAAELGLPAGIPIAVGAFDAHLGAVGAGVGTGRLVKIIGTSTCDIMVSPNDAELPDIPGVCGIVDGSVIPGGYGIEAGQSAVGDIFNWFVTKVCGADHARFAALTAEASRLAPGASGLLALDWQNGNRTILVDPKLSGLIVGMTLRTSQAEIYRALIEATAFGARKIIDRLEEFGVHIAEIVCCGGIAEKDAMFMQIYADVLNRPMRISGSPQTCALGAAMFGAVVAGEAAGGYAKIEDAQQAMCSFKAAEFAPIPANAAAYAELYRLYDELHDSFGIAGGSFDHSKLMKELLDISAKARRG